MIQIKSLMWKEIIEKDYILFKTVEVLNKRTVFKHITQKNIVIGLIILLAQIPTGKHWKEQFQASEF